MASITQDLELFVREALLRGAGRPDVQQALVSAGWSVQQAQAALSAYADLAFPVPVPKPRAYLSAREAFLYLVLFTALYLSAYHFGSLLFDLINQHWPDPAANPAGDMWHIAEREIRWSIASMIIAFPVYLLMSRYLGRELARAPMKRLSAVRRWLTYLTLFIAAGFVIGDLITLVDNVLGGELTLRFLLKVGVVAAIAGTIFSWYLIDLRRDERGS